MNNLLLPGPRRRTWAAAGRPGAGAAPATTGSWSSSARAARPRVIEVDTNHFKGNYPDRCSLEAHRRAGRRAHHRARSRAAHWRPLLPRDEARGATRATSSTCRRARAARHARAPQHLPRRRRQPAAGLGARAMPEPHDAARTRCSDEEARARRSRAAAARRAGSAACWRGGPFADAAALLDATPTRSGRRSSATTTSRPSRTTRRSAASSASCASSFAATAAWSRAGAGRRRRGRRRDTLEALRDGNAPTARASATSSSSAPRARARPRCCALLAGAPRQRPRAELAIAAARAGQDHPRSAWRSSPMSGITTHVLDTALGTAGARPRACGSTCSAPTAAVALRRRRASPTPTAASRDFLAARRRSSARTYRLTFETGAYFAAAGRAGRSTRGSRSSSP